MSEPNSFPQVLYDYWHASDEDLSAAIEDGVFRDVSVSTLLIAYLHVQLQGDKEYDDVSPPSLFSLVIRRIITELQSAEDLSAEAMNILESLDHVTYRRLLLDARLPYPILRAFSKIPFAKLPSSAFSLEEMAIGIDDSVLANEDFLRRSKAHARDNKHLVTLDDLCNILGISSREGLQHFRRENFDLVRIELGTRKPRFTIGPEIENQIRSRDLDFSLEFEKLSFDLLRNLNWANVYVTGPPILACLTNLDIKAEKIHIHIYGLDVHEAERKVDHIYQTWLSNHEADEDNPDLVIKSANVGLSNTFPVL